MDKVNNIIDLYEVANLTLFMLLGFGLLWIIGKIQKKIKQKKRKNWKRKKINMH